MGMRAWIGAAAVAVAIAAAGHAAHATAVVGTTTFSDNGPSGNGLLFSGSFLNAGNLNLNLAVGTPDVINNFLSITSNDTNHGFFGQSTAQDNIAANFTFTKPGAGQGSVSGAGSETEGFFFGHVTGSSGQITWNGPLQINFANGAELKITLSNAAFDTGSYNPNQTVTVNATFTLLQDVSGTPQGGSVVPEPASLVVLSAGLLGIGFIARRRKRN